MSAVVAAGARELPRADEQEAQAPTVRIRDLRVAFRRRGGDVGVLHGVDLDIRHGEIVSVVGESGSGKSMMAGALAGLLPARATASGTAEVDGVDMVSAPERARRAARRSSIGMVFQDPMTALNPTMRIGRQLRATTGSDVESIRVLERAGIPDARSRLRAYPHELSGGLRQRVMIGLAIAGRPRLLIADEPTTALDVHVQAQVLSLIRELRDEIGLSILFITHDLGVASELADRIVVMHRGRIVEEGRADRILGGGTHPYTRALNSTRITMSSRRDVPLPMMREDGSGEMVAGVWPEPVVELTVPAVLDIRGARKTFAVRGGVRTALDGVDLVVRPGEAVAVVGQSGSGKSTLLRVAAGLEKLTAGEVIHHDGAQASAQMVFQDAGSSLTPWLRVGEQIAERLRGDGLSRAETARRVSDVLVTVGLTPTHARRFPSELSGGQRQRVAIARAIVKPPALLLCDEPTSALDASLVAVVLNLLGEIRRRLGIALLFVTHDLAAARLVGDRIVVMADGRVVEEGDAVELIQNPRADYTRELLRAIPGT